MTKIADLTIVPVPADTDEYVINQAGNDFKITRAQIVAAAQATLQAQITSNDTDIANLQSDKASKAGDTFTGAVVLSLSPSLASHATRKDYVDSAVASKLDLSGGTMTGFLVLNADPSVALGAATKQYVDTLRTSTIKVLENYNPTTTSAFPVTYASAAIKKGDSFFITTAGTMAAGVVVVESGDILIAKIDTPTDSASDWAVINTNIVTASTTVQGIVELATQAEAEALTDATRAITPDTLDDVLERFVFKRVQVGAALKNLTEDEIPSILRVTFTSSGAVTINLPSTGSLVRPSKARVVIVDEGGAAGTNNITINASSGQFINGSASFVINKNYEAVTIYTNGTNWFTSSDRLNTSSTNEELKKALVSLSALQVSNLNTSPVNASISSPGVNKIINVITVLGLNKFVTTAYSGNEVRLRYVGAQDIAQFSGTFTTTTSARYENADILEQKSLSTNTQLEFYIPTANPTLGDGTMKFEILYKITELS